MKTENQVGVGNHGVLSGPDRFAITGDAFNGFGTTAIRTEESIPCAFRFAQYPDGSKRLQGGYRWTEGFAGGIAWRDVPCVRVDGDGQEIEPEPEPLIRFGDWNEEWDR